MPSRIAKAAVIDSSRRSSTRSSDVPETSSMTRMGLGRAGGVEGHEAREVRVGRQREQGARLLAEQVQELLLGERARVLAVVGGNFERVRLGALVVALVGALRDEHRTGCAAAEGTLDVEAAEEAGGRQPGGQAQPRRREIGGGRAHGRSVGETVARQIAQAREDARDGVADAAGKSARNASTASLMKPPRWTSRRAARIRPRLRARARRRPRSARPGRSAAPPGRAPPRRSL